MEQCVLGTCHRVEAGEGTHAYLQGEKGTPWTEQASCIGPDRSLFSVLGPINWRENLIPIILILT